MHRHPEGLLCTRLPAPDNGSSHIAKATKRWLEAHPRFVAHSTPPHASRVHEVELVAT